MAAGGAIELTGGELSVEQVARVARDYATVALSEQARQAVQESARYLDQLIADRRPVYGLTTGVGALDGQPVSAEDNREQQQNLLRSHAAGIGAPMRHDEVRAMVLVRANVLAGGMTGVQPETLDTLLAMLNKGVTPDVPDRGSVGACGDLAPLAHMALPLIGEGHAWYEGERMAGAEALRRAEIHTPVLKGRDGLALINGTEQTTGIGCLALVDAQRLVAHAETAAAMSLEALGAVADSFDEETALAKPHPGQMATSARLRELTSGSGSVTRPAPGRLRDGLSLRCIPQVLGATRESVEAAERVLTIEINAANDNPLFGVRDGWVTSNSGNFHGQQAAQVLDFLAMSVTSLAVISERRSARLIDQHHSGGLPPFLIHPEARPGLNSGMMIAQYTAASLIGELRTRSSPASIQSVPTCANTEDHVPMAPIAARHAEWAVRTAETVVAIELLLAAQALDIRGARPGEGVAACYKSIRETVPVMVRDRVLGDDIEAIVELIRGDRLSD